MARSTPLKWIQEQGGWTTAKLLLDTYGHFMPSETHGFADALSAAPNGPGTAPIVQAVEGTAGDCIETVDKSAGYEDVDSSVQPRSPIMHFTLPPPFFRNSDTSTVTGATPRSRTSS